MTDRKRKAARGVDAWLTLPFLLLILAGLGLALGRGFELSDEAYYLAWIIAPDAYRATIQPFGLFFHPLWRATESLIALRAAGVLLLLGSGALLGWAATLYYRGAGLLRGRAALVLPAMVASLAYYVLGMLTPSYNLLANVAASLVAAGLFGWFRREAGGRADDGASLLIGLGACLAFLAKPTLAAIFALAVAAVLLADWRERRGRMLRRAALVALACFAPLLTLIAATVGIGGFIASVGEGLAVLRFGNSVADLVRRAPLDLYNAPAFLAVAATAAAFTTALQLRGGEEARPRPALRLLTLLVFALTALALVIEVAGSDSQALWNLVGPPVLALALAVVALGVTSAGGRASGTATLLPLALLLCLPLAIAFGSANRWLPQTGLSLMPMLLVILISARLHFAPWAARTADLVVGLGVTLALVAASQAPYRLAAPLQAQSQPITVPFTADTLRVDGATRDFVRTLREIGTRGGVTPTTPIVDLSDQGPGAALLLGGRLPYFPWLVAGYGNAVPLADAAWASLTPEEQAAAWFVTPVATPFTPSAPIRHLHARQGGYEFVGRARHPVSGLLVAIWRPRPLRPG